MRFLITAVVFTVLFVWMLVSSIAGLIVMVFILLLIGLLDAAVSRNTTFDINMNIPDTSHISDHYVDTHIETVPLEYYSAYSAYLKSSEWRAFRKTVLKRDRYRCVDCQVYGYNVDTNPTGPLLQVHHIHYDGIETMTFTTDQCVSVCPACHDKRHGKF